MGTNDLLPEHPAELTLLDYLLCSLPEDASDRISRHVRGCRACRRTIADLSLTVDELDRLPTAAIPHDQVAGAVRHRPRGGTISRLVPAALIMIALTLALYTLQTSPDASRSSSGARPTSLVLRATGTGAQVVAEVQRAAGVRSSVVQDAAHHHQITVVVNPGDVDRAVSNLRTSQLASYATGPSYLVNVAARDLSQTAPSGDAKDLIDGP